MSNYTKTTNFASKDSLPSGNANKIVKGTEIDTEFNNIATAVATKADTAGPTFTGTVTIPTADINGGAVDGTTIGASSASSIVGTTIVANTSINIAGDGATVTGIKDEDDMSSNSATKLATQQSIKAYVDSQVTAQDLDVTDGSSSIDIDLDSESLGILGGTGIDSTASGTGVTLAIDSTVTTLTGSQTLTNKTLTAPTLTGTTVVASLDISGDVDVDGTLETDALSINGTTVTSTAAELNILDGVTSTAAELNILDGVTSTTAELNILDGVTSTTAELNILDGVTATAAELNIMDGVTATTAELNIMDGVTSTAAELNILDGKAFLDEDDMSSNSATGIASQQSIKAYVDAQITAEDLDFQADSGGALSIDLDSETLTFTGGTGIDTSGSGNAVTFAIDSTVATLTGSQTLTNKSLTAPTLTGTAVVASLDISGDIDVDGTTNLDVVDIDGAVDFASTTAHAGNASFADNAKAIFGADSDLQIYHGGGHSIIEEGGTGALKIKGDDVRIENSSGNNIIKAVSNSAELYENGSKKLETTSTGIDVTGSVTANGGVVVDNITIDGQEIDVSSGDLTLDVAGDIILDADNSDIILKDNGTTFGQFTNDSGNLIIYNSGSQMLKGLSGGSDAYFVGNLGIGTSSLSNKLDIKGTVGFEATNSTNKWLAYTYTDNTLRLNYNGAGADELVLDSSGRVGVGGAPNADWRNDLSDDVLMLGTEATLHSDGGVTTELWNNAYVNNSNTFKNISTRGASRYLQYSGAHKWFTAASASAGSTISTEINSSPKMVLDVSGNLGIGVSNPSNPLSVLGASGTIASFTNGADADLLIKAQSGVTTLTPSTGTLAFGTSSTEAMRIDSNGHIHTGYTSSFGGDHVNVLASDGGGIAIAQNNAGTATSGTTLGSLSFQTYLNGQTFAEADARISAIAAENQSGSAAGTDLAFYTKSNGTGPGSSPTERMRIDSSGSLRINNTRTTATKLHVVGGTASGTMYDTAVFAGGQNSTSGSGARIYLSGCENDPISRGAVIQGEATDNSNGHALIFKTSAASSAPSERMRIDSSGNLLVGTTDSAPAVSSSEVGVAISGGSGYVAASRSNSASGFFNRLSNGEIVAFNKDGSLVGSISTYSSTIQVGQGNAFLKFANATDTITPANGNGTNNDDAIDLGSGSARFVDIYATNGTIQTSDRNEKQDIEALSDAEQRVAVAAKGLLRKFRWKSSVEEKGDDARIHFGIIAQDLQDAFTAEGLDAGRYAMFISSTWTDEETGEERTRLGVRYSELLAFIISAI